MKYLTQFKWWLIYILLTKNEKVLFTINLNRNEDNLEKYSDCLGETFEEYREELIKFKLQLKTNKKL